MVERGGAEHMGARAIATRRDRGPEARGPEEHEHVDPARQQDRRQQQQQDVARTPCPRPRRPLRTPATSSSSRWIWEIPLDMNAACTVGQVQGHVGDQQDPDRVVDPGSAASDQATRYGAHDHARDGESGRRRDGVEDPAVAGPRCANATQAITKVRPVTMSGGDARPG